MLSDIRDHIKTQMQTVNSDYKEWTDALNFENIPSPILESRYYMVYSLGAITPAQLTEIYSINIELKLFSKGQRDTVAEYDSLMDRAEIAKNQIVNYGNIGDDYVGIDATSLVIEPIATSNDNKMIATINFVATKRNCIAS